MDQSHARVSYLGINIFLDLLNATIIYIAYDKGNALCIQRSEHRHVCCISSYNHRCPNLTGDIPKPQFNS